MFLYSQILREHLANSCKHYFFSILLANKVKFPQKSLFSYSFGSNRTLSASCYLSQKSFSLRRKWMRRSRAGITKRSSRWTLVTHCWDLGFRVRMRSPLALRSSWINTSASRREERPDDFPPSVSSGSCSALLSDCQLRFEPPAKLLAHSEQSIQGAC